MVYYLRYGVAVLLGLAWVLCVGGLWFWQGEIWYRGYLALTPLPEWHAVERKKWSWPSVSAALLQRQLMYVFAAKGSALQLQTSADSVDLHVLLSAHELHSMASLPLWPGWYLSRMALQQAGVQWRLDLQWRTVDEGDGVKVVAVSISDKAIDPSIWRPSVPVSAPAMALVDVAPDVVASKLDWQLLGYWRQDNSQGVWLLDGSDVLQKLAQGERWRGFQLLEIGPHGVSWRGNGSQIFKQPLCNPFKACGDGL